MSNPNLTGTVSGVKKLDALRVNVTVEIEDPTVPAEHRVEGSAQEITVPMPIEKAKSMGIGTKVELTLKRVSTRTKKAAGEAQTAAGEGGDADPGANDETDGAAEGDAPAPAATPATTGRRRAAAAAS